MPREHKQQKADAILNNDRDLALVKTDLLRLHKNYLQLALKNITVKHSLSTI